ncbi:MAG: carboxylating nicotinate-nucleotide diphosphorylase [Planctomycetes bacterium]|nr:carboxylating nicotinate-nucleotide diphosphorylase [Planctomycetota bacterium]
MNSDKATRTSDVRFKPTRAERQNLWRLLEMARDEDLGSGDLTGAMLGSDVQAEAVFVPRQPMVTCGVELLEAIAVMYSGDLHTRTLVHDGQRVEPGEPLAIWTGSAKAAMAAERVALNFLQRLSGVATLTRQYVDAVAGTSAHVYDTRKTIPGWRELAKYAVRCGGGRNHRMGLWDAVLIKDNHLAIMARAEGQDPIKAMGRELERVRPYLGNTAFVMLEVDTLEQFAVALTLKVDIIMLDNMNVQQMRTAVAMREQAGLAARIELEASGGITLQTVRAVAQTGVERISVGAITHSAESVDIGLDIQI